MKKLGLSFPYELITGIDVINTLNGGMSEPVIKTSIFTTHREIKVRIPGVDVSHVRTEINNNELMIYYYTILISRHRELKFPKVLYNNGIPYYVDSNKITASEGDGSLVIRLPYNELANGNHRDISVIH